MSLKQYVKPVGCVSPRASVVEACRRMDEREIGAVVVISDDEKPIGLLTDRDVVIRLIAAGKKLDGATVEQVMTSGVATLPEGSSISECTEVMRDRGIRRVAIVDAGGRVTGMVSLDDLLLLLGIEMGNLASAIFSGLAARTLESEEEPRST